MSKKPDTVLTVKDSKFFEEKTYGKYEFNEKELAEIAEKMSHALHNLKIAEDELKSLSSSMKAKINGFEAEVSILSENYRNKYEYKEILCDVELNFRTKKRIYRRQDTGQIIIETDLRKEDYQENLFDVEPEAVGSPV